MTATPWTVEAVVVFCLAASAACLVLAALLAVRDSEGKDARRALRSRAVRLSAKEDLAGVDLDGMAKLADAMQHLDWPGRFLLFALGFAAAAAGAAGLAAIG